MPAHSRLTRRAPRRTPASATLILLLFIPLLLASCTRAEVASALATVSVDLQATLEPLSATVVAGGLMPQRATTEATVQATVPPLPHTADTGTLVPPTAMSVPTATSVSIATVAPTATARPTMTSSPTTPPSPTALPPTATLRPSPTPVPSPTPYPDAMDLGGATMILVPGGPFEMGASASDILAECNTFRTGCQVAWFTASAPRHEMRLAPFYIDQFEVTNVAYLSFLNDPAATGAACDEQPCLDLDETQLQAADTGGYQIEPELAIHPVAGITWPGAAAFCAWRGGRLPSEAEWEKAALWNPETGAGTRYPWGDIFDGRAVNFCDAGCDAPQANPDSNDGFATTAPVGSFPDGRSAFGMYDMAGNVWEWVGDWFSETYYAESATENPTGPAEGTEKVVRGGSWYDTGNFTSGFIRFPSVPENADKTIGFRCAFSP